MNISEYKEPIFLAATVGLAVATCYKHLTFQQVRYSVATGIISSCSLQILAIATGREGLGDPKRAALITYLLGAINLSYWLMFPFEPITLSIALCSVAFKVSTLVFQRFYPSC